MEALIEQMVGEVISVADDDPENASTIYGDAAERFREAAQHRQSVGFAGTLLDRAAMFEAKAQEYKKVYTSSDDFDELEHEHARAHQEVGHMDDLAIKARSNALHQERHATARISITPRSVTEKTPLGRTAMVKFNPSTDEILNGISASGTVLMWQGTKTESQAFTIDVSTNIFPAYGSQFVFSGASIPEICRPYGIITYGTDGNKSSFKFDVGLGVRFTGVGNYCDVLVGMDPVPAGNVSGIMTLGASLGFFAAPSPAPVMLTSYIDNLVPTFSTLPIFRPARAVFILPPQGTDVTGQWQIDFLDCSQTIVYSVNFVNSSVVSPIPVSNDVAAVIVTNKGTKTASMRLPWQLST